MGGGVLAFLCSVDGVNWIRMWATVEALHLKMEADSWFRLRVRVYSSGTPGNLVISGYWVESRKTS